MWKVADSSLLIVNATWAITLTDVLNYNQVKFNHSAFQERRGQEKNRKKCGLLPNPPSVILSNF